MTETTTSPIETFAQFEAVMAEGMPNYESRPQQQEFAALVEHGLAEGRHVIAEAGCGTGKSFGYSIPAALAAVREKKRVVVSTATKALQDQLANEDLPFLQAKMAEAGLPFSWAVLKGRGNYLCPEKAMTADTPLAARVLEHAKAAAGDGGFHGEQHEFPFEIPPADWYQVAAESEDCSDMACREKNLCYAEQARRRARAANLVVVNHALLFTDLMVKVSSDGVASMLDHYDAVVFDEAHEAEDWATKTLGTKFSEGAFKGLVGEVRRLATRVGQDASFTEEPIAAMGALWRRLRPGTLTERTLVDCEAEFLALAEALIDMHKRTAALSLAQVSQAEFDAYSKKKRRAVARARGLADRFTAMIVATSDEMVRWVEEDRKGAVTIQTAPIDVAPFLRANLFSKVQASLVSATMSVAGSFDYIAGRLGVDDYDYLDVGSPFDFARQSALYVPADLPAPAYASKQAWEQQAPERTLDLVLASRGRALLLFTSVSAMRNTHAKIAGRIPYKVLVQGERPNKALAAEFKDDTDSVLFATKSFFTGTDVQGESLSLVVIDKLPFVPPTDAVFGARCDSVERHGGNAFSDLTIPTMSLVLKQAHGRLIRHRGDTGVVAILDSRLLTKGYGRKILSALPPSRLVKSVEEVYDFFGTDAEHVREAEANDDPWA